MTQDEIKHGLLQVCKVKGWDSDFNVVGFHVLCDKLKELGAIEEREKCADLVFGMVQNIEIQIGKPIWAYLHEAQSAIRARGEA